jgi:WhiB family redox-sensing transcriptional regulator
MVRHLGDLIDDDRPWAMHAACRGMDSDWFFPGPDGDTKAARRVCRGCPVQEECLDWALAAGIRYGVWGGHTEAERRHMLRRSA